MTFANSNVIWCKIKLGDIGVLRNGYAFKHNSYTKDGLYNIITISNVQGNRYIDIDDKTNKVMVVPSNISEFQKLKNGDILVSLTGNVGRVSINKGGNNLLNQRVGLFDIINILFDKEYIYALMSTKYFENVMIAQAQGAAQLNISKRDIEDYEVFIPVIESSLLLEE